MLQSIPCKSYHHSCLTLISDVDLGESYHFHKLAFSEITRWEIMGKQQLRGKGNVRFHCYLFVKDIHCCRSCSYAAALVTEFCMEGAIGTKHQTKFRTTLGSRTSMATLSDLLMRSIKHRLIVKTSSRRHIKQNRYGLWTLWLGQHAALPISERH